MPDLSSCSRSGPASRRNRCPLPGSKRVLPVSSTRRESRSARQGQRSTQPALPTRARSGSSFAHPILAVLQSQVKEARVTGFKGTLSTLNPAQHLRWQSGRVKHQQAGAEGAMSQSTQDAFVLTEQARSQTRTYKPSGFWAVFLLIGSV